MEHCMDCGFINHAELSKKTQGTFVLRIKKFLATIRIVGAEEMSKIK